MKTPGQIDYERDVQQKPLYHTGQPRKTWEELSEITRWSWERGATKPPTQTYLPSLILFFALTALSACSVQTPPPRPTLMYVDCGGTARNISLAEYRNQPRCVQI